MDYWTILSSLSTAFAAIVVLIAAIFAYRQLEEMSKSRKTNTFSGLYKFLQQQEIREARGTLIGLKGKKFKNWTEEDIIEAEKASQAYDFAGRMVSEELIEKELVAKTSRDSIIKCWEAAEPMIREYRKNRGGDFWKGFEILYDKAKQN